MSPIPHLDSWIENDSWSDSVQKRVILTARQGDKTENTTKKYPLRGSYHRGHWDSGAFRALWYIADIPISMNFNFISSVSEPMEALQALTRVAKTLVVLSRT